MTRSDGWSVPARWSGLPEPRPVERPALRIGDAERDRAVAALGEHFAAGRLTREELDQRVDQAITARVDADLEPLFVDLPRSPEPGSPAVVGARTAHPGFRLPGLLPVLLVAAVVTAVVLSAPWVVWSSVWVFLTLSWWGRRHAGRWGPPRHHRLAGTAYDGGRVDAG